MPKIKLSLNASDVDRALKDAEAYKKKVKNAGDKLTTALTEQGVSLAQQNAAYMNIYDSGELVNGITSKYDNDKGYVYSGADHSAFCEFGTGVVGQGSPHPDPIDGWEYGVNEHGEEGWWYYDDNGTRHWTKGMPSRPYMYDTARMLRDMVPKMAKEVMK